MASFQNLPPLAGLCTLEEAAKPGLLVEECVRRLKRFHYAFVRLHAMLTARITSEPVYELKTAFAHQAWLCAEHATSLRQRVSEMREPPLGLEEAPSPELQQFFDEIQNAPSVGLFVQAVYSTVMKNLMVAMEAYVNETHPLTDAPSNRVLKFAWMELDTMYCTGVEIIDALVDDRSEYQEWHSSTLEPLWNDQPSARKYSEKPFTYDPIPQRDERFTDLWNQGVNAEAFLYSEKYPASAKALMMLYKRLREIDVPEMMARIITQTPGKPWGYYRDMSRQLWDEARHAMMGEVGFHALGVDWTHARVTWNWSYRLNTECTPLEAHAVLFFIEQGLMPKTGKRYEFEVAQESGIPLMATIQDFDWADEVLHSQIGRQWLVPEFGTLQKALHFGDEAWSRITSNWAAVRDQGLTRHANWWPNIYRQACQHRGVEPDPVILAYDETYEAKRADIHRTAAE